MQNVQRFKVKNMLGDAIAKVTHALGIEQCDACKERQQKLNKLFPYAKPQCLTEDEFNYLDAYFELKTNQLTSEQQRELIKINNRVLNQKLTFSSCSS